MAISMMLGREKQSASLLYIATYCTLKLRFLFAFFYLTTTDAMRAQRRLRQKKPEGALLAKLLLSSADSTSQTNTRVECGKWMEMSRVYGDDTTSAEKKKLVQERTCGSSCAAASRSITPVLKERLACELAVAVMKQ